MNPRRASHCSAVTRHRAPREVGGFRSAGADFAQFLPVPAARRPKTAEFQPCAAELPPCAAEFEPCAADFQPCATAFQPCAADLQPCAAKKLGCAAEKMGCAGERRGCAAGKRAPRRPRFRRAVRRTRREWRSHQSGWTQILHVRSASVPGLQIYQLSPTFGASTGFIPVQVIAAAGIRDLSARSARAEHEEHRWNSNQRSRQP